MNIFGRGTARGTSFLSLLFARHLVKFKKNKKKERKRKREIFSKNFL